MNMGCSNSTPVINRFTYELKSFVNPAAGSYAEELSLWLTFSDKDGIDDIEEIVLTMVDEELEWRFTEFEWVKNVLGSYEHVGHVKIVGPESDFFPKGKYRVDISDKALNIDSRVFPISDSDIDFQSLVPTIESDGDNNWTLNSILTDVYIYALEGDSKIIGLTRLSSGKISLDESLYQIHPIYLFARYRERSLMSGPYFISY